MHANGRCVALAPLRAKGLFSRALAVSFFRYMICFVCFLKSWVYSLCWVSGAVLVKLFVSTATNKNLAGKNDTPRCDFYHPRRDAVTTETLQLKRFHSFHQRNFFARQVYHRVSLWLIAIGDERLRLSFFFRITKNGLRDGQCVGFQGAKFGRCTSLAFIVCNVTL